MLLKVLLAFEPRVVIETTQTMMINAVAAGILDRSRAVFMLEN